MESVIVRQSAISNRQSKISEYTHDRFFRSLRQRRRRADHAANPIANPREARRGLYRGGNPRAGERQAREIPGSARGPLGSARAVPAQARSVAAAELQVR